MCELFPTQVALQTLGRQPLEVVTAVRASVCGPRNKLESVVAHLVQGTFRGTRRRSLPARATVRRTRRESRQNGLRTAHMVWWIVRRGLMTARCLSEDARRGLMTVRCLREDVSLMIVRCVGTRCLREDSKWIISVR